MGGELNNGCCISHSGIVKAAWQQTLVNKSCPKVEKKGVGCVKEEVERIMGDKERRASLVRLNGLEKNTCLGL